jgi:hypothetical protein
LALGRLEKRLTSLIPIYGLVVSMSHNGISKICRKCYRYHKRDMSCVKRHWQDYVAQFKTENPRIKVSMIDEDVKEEPNEDIGHIDTKHQGGA